MANDSLVVTCPDCRSAYALPAGAIGATGRMVRCIDCSHIWYEMPAGAPAGASPDDRPAEPGEVDFLFDLSAPADDRRPVETAADPEAIEPESVESRALVPLRGGRDEAPAGTLLHAVIVDAETAERLRRSPRFRPAYLPGARLPARRRPPDRRLGAGALAGAAGLILLAIVLRAPLVSAMPSLGGLFAAAGMEVNLAGLEFRDVVAERRVERGTPILEVEAEIANVSGRDMAVPAVRLVVRRAGADEAYSWLVEPARASLAAGEHISFRSRLAMPPGGGEDVELRFAPRRTEMAELR